MKKSDAPVGTHVFNFNPHDNGGESLLLVTKFIPNGDPNTVYMQQELTLNSYCNSATFNLLGVVITPELLRNMANELDRARIDAEKTVSVVHG